MLVSCRYTATVYIELDSQREREKERETFSQEPFLDAVRSWGNSNHVDQRDFTREFQRVSEM